MEKYLNRVDMEGSVAEKDRKERGVEDEKKKIKKERKTSKSSVTDFYYFILIHRSTETQRKMEEVV